MNLLTKVPKGTQDFLPEDTEKLRFLENTIHEIAQTYGYGELRTPVFEHTELFERGVGNTTDVVEKEMYTFFDKGNRSITLRPEGTAGAVRAYIENGLFNNPAPTKLYYFTSCYRYERPQAGRMREFHQFGVECFGASDASADAETIALACNIFDFFGVKNITLNINSIGCPTCRKAYREALKEYFIPYLDSLCGDCRERIDKNPMRIIDCKADAGKDFIKNAPSILDYLCEDCREHFEKLKNYLDEMEIDYIVNPRIVRGLDYYTRTVFEFVSMDIGSQSTVLGGGRYDGLVEELGGKPTSALGFGMGMERFKLVLENQGFEFPKTDGLDLYLISIGEKAKLKTVALARDLRLDGVRTGYDLIGRAVKAQMKYANKISALYSCVLGDDELEKGKATVKNMHTGKTAELCLENFSEEFDNLLISETLDDIAGAKLDTNMLSKFLSGDKH